MGRAILGSCPRANCAPTLPAPVYHSFVEGATYRQREEGGIDLSSSGSSLTKENFEEKCLPEMLKILRELQLDPDKVSPIDF